MLDEKLTNRDAWNLGLKTLPALNLKGEASGRGLRCHRASQTDLPLRPRTPGRRDPPTLLSHSAWGARRVRGRCCAPALKCRCFPEAREQTEAPPTGRPRPSGSGRRCGRRRPRCHSARPRDARGHPGSRGRPRRGPRRPPGGGPRDLRPPRRLRLLRLPARPAQGGFAPVAVAQ